MSTEPFRDTVRTMLRDRLLDAASHVFSQDGWRRLTMARVAARAGVSRQTVYNEFGAKQQLAEQLVMRELDHFLEVVQRSFEAETELVPAVRSAIEGALETAESSALLRAIVESGQSGDTDLLPFIIQSQDLIDRATEFLIALVEERYPDLPVSGAQLAVAMESVVRLVLSHVTQPSGTPHETAQDLGFIIDAVLAGVPHLDSRATA